VRQTLVETRRFDVDSAQVRERLEAIGATFAAGYNLAINTTDVETLEHALELIEATERGFAYEGAAMGLTISDWIKPWRACFPRFLSGSARHHEYMVWVGRGWAYGLPLSPLRDLSRHQSVHRWLALDGFGFKQGYFGWRRAILGQRRPASLPGMAARVFDQGLGRSMWFVFGANAGKIGRAISRFEDTRHDDLWSGVGLACAYAGGTTECELECVSSAAEKHFPALAQGVVFAAQARRRACNPAPHTAVACDRMLAMTPDAAADLAMQCFPSTGTTLEDYQQWRLAIQARFAG
jgi:hypothetical protein